MVDSAVTASDDDLIRLSYLSSSCTLLPAGELDRILAVARKRNSDNDVTGLLLYHDGCFFQTLEGRRAIVEETYARITRDSRHISCIVLEKAEVPSRLFGDWAMAFRRYDKLSPAEQDGFHEILGMRADAVAEGKSTATLTLIGSFLNGFRDLGEA